nr:MAG TPA: Major head protein [Caudoviricetes sp.]
MENEKTFTQAEMDSIIEGRLAREHEKYADYDSLKEKAGKYDEMQEQSKSELQKANEKANALQAQLDQLKKDGTVRQVREKVAKDTSVPVELLTGEDEETCKKQAEAILKFAKPKSYPGTKGNKKNMTEHHEKDDAMREFAHQIFGKGE